jgi:hypothetical protein
MNERIMPELSFTQIRRVEQVCGSVKALDPVVCWHRSMEKWWTNDIIDGTNNTINFTIF